MVHNIKDQVLVPWQPHCISARVEGTLLHSAPCLHTTVFSLAGDLCCNRQSTFTSLYLPMFITTRLGEN